MSILIKGMDMPKSCSDCGQFRWSKFLQSDVCRIEEVIGGDGLFKFEDEGIAKRPPWCPLVGIPPHGRLIDADALIQNKDVNSYDAVFAVAKAPTIIEAEAS